MSNVRNMPFLEAVRGLLAGDFSRLAPLFETPAGGSPCPIIKWFEDGLFANETKALDEAFTCACFNGCTNVIESFLAKGLNPNGGDNMGLNAFHWAANRGQFKAVEILILHKASLETLNSYGGTVLGCAVWSAIHEPKPDHLRIIEALLNAGANINGAEYPSGNERVDELLRRYGAGRE